MEIFVFLIFSKSGLTFSKINGPLDIEVIKVAIEMIIMLNNCIHKGKIIYTCNIYNIFAIIGFPFHFPMQKSLSPKITVSNC